MMLTVVSIEHAHNQLKCITIYYKEKCW